MATQNLGELGRSESAPVFFQWRWYYNTPGLPPWILLLLLAVVPKHNRNRQAWMILLLPLLAAGFWLLIQFVFAESSEIDSVGQFLVALAIAWASVWLVGPWLIRTDRMRTLLGAGAVVLLVGIAAYLGYFGFWLSSEITWPVVGFWGVCSVPLIAAMALTGLCCRGHCTPPRLVFWPMLWLPVVSLSCVGVFAIVVLAIEGSGDIFSAMEMLTIVAIQGIVISGFLAGMLYVLNLPVILLCIFTPCYRQRFQEVFCRTDSRFPMTAPLPTVESDSLGANPFRA